MTTPFFQDDRITLYQGHAMEVLRALPDESVDCCVTSPPYWALRCYGTEDLIWGGNPACDHQWDSAPPPRGNRGRSESDIPNSPKQSGTGAAFNQRPSGSCAKCGAWKGSLGQEPTPDLFVSNLKMIFHEVYRVLRPHGTLWLNIADSYCATDKWGGGGTNTGKHVVAADGSVASWGNRRDKRDSIAGLKPKDLVGIPWMAAFALRADGWYLRSDIIWGKSVPMPESVKDRTTKAHEYVFLMSKNADYFYDWHAIATPAKHEGVLRSYNTPKKKARVINGTGSGNESDNAGPVAVPAMVNARDVWMLGPEPSGIDEHFATMPLTLAKRCLLAGTSAKGCCDQCGAPWEKIIEKPSADHAADSETKFGEESTAGRLAMLRQAARANGSEYANSPVFKGWRPSCECKDAGIRRPVVLDPFNGAATTGVAARELGCNYIGIDLNPKYLQISVDRLRQQVLF